VATLIPFQFHGEQSMIGDGDGDDGGDDEAASRLVPFL